MATNIPTPPTSNHHPMALSQMAERKKTWEADDKERSKRAGQGRLQPHETLFSQYLALKRKDEVEEDIARLLEKLYVTFDFEPHFPLASGLQFLVVQVREAVEYGRKSIDPMRPNSARSAASQDTCVKTLGMRRLLVSKAFKRMELGLSDYTDDSITDIQLNRLFRNVALAVWHECLDAMYAARFRTGEGLEACLKERREYYVQFAEICTEMNAVYSLQQNLQKPSLLLDYDFANSSLSTSDSDSSVEPPTVAPALPSTGAISKHGLTTVHPEKEFLANSAPNVNVYMSNRRQPMDPNFPAANPPPPAHDNGRMPQGAYQPYGANPPLTPRPNPPIRTDSVMTAQEIAQRGDLSAEQKLDLIAHLPTQPTAPPPSHTSVSSTGGAQYPGAMGPPTPYIYSAAHTTSSVQLPPFYGNPGEFSQWFDFFIQTVDMNPTIPPILKLHALQKSLKKRAAHLGQELPYTAESYEILKATLWEEYGNKQDTVRALSRRLRSWPEINEKFQDIADFIGFSAQLVRQHKTIRGGGGGRGV